MQLVTIVNDLYIGLGNVHSPQRERLVAQANRTYRFLRGLASEAYV